MKTDRKKINCIKVLRTIAVLMTVLFAAFNFLYNVTQLSGVFELSSFLNQHIYQENDEKNGALGDAYIRELIRYRTVTVPYEIKGYAEYSDQEEEERGSNFSQKYYHENNFTRYFSAYSKECRADKTLPEVNKVRQAREDGTFRFDDFTNLGISNDMLRYSFMLNDEGQRESSYFWYSWYYYSFAEEKEWYGNIYILKDECEKSDSLVAIWDSRSNLFIMPDEYYDDNYRQMFDEYVVKEVKKK